MARRKGSPRLSPEELERMRNDPRRVISDTFRPAPGRSVTSIPEGVVVPPAGSGRNFNFNRDSIRPSPSNPRRPGRPGIDFEIGGGPVGRRLPGYTQPGGGPDDFGRPAVGYNRPDRGRTLDEYRGLIDRLRGSRDKARRGRDSSKSRSYDRRKAEADRRQTEYKANQDRYRGDFTYSGGTTQQVVVPWHNPETGARWSAPNPGYKPKEGTGWVKGYGPKNGAISEEMKKVINVAYLMETPNKSVPKKTEETPNKGSKFEAMLRARMGKF